MTLDSMRLLLIPVPSQFPLSGDRNREQSSAANERPLALVHSNDEKLATDPVCLTRAILAPPRSCRDGSATAPVAHQQRHKVPGRIGRHGLKLLIGRLKTLLGFCEVTGLNRIKAETSVSHTHLVGRGRHRAPLLNNNSLAGHRSGAR
jgi:hypothetical protein